MNKFALIGEVSGKHLTWGGRVITHTNRAELEFLIPKGAKIEPISSSGRMLIGTILAPFGIRNSSSALLVWVITRPPHVRCLPETSPIRANLFMPPPNASATRTHKRRISHRPPLLFEAH